MRKAAVHLMRQGRQVARRYAFYVSVQDKRAEVVEKHSGVGRGAATGIVALLASFLSRFQLAHRGVQQLVPPASGAEYTGVKAGGRCQELRGHAVDPDLAVPRRVDRAY